jgi:DNA-binding MarR family transcriptional regulator
MTTTSETQAPFGAERGAEELVGDDLAPEVREALEAQSGIYKAIMNLHSDDWLSLDLPMGQLKALFTVMAHGGMTVSEIAESLNTGKPSASMIVDGLTHRGYVTRREDPNDRRRTLVAPTDAGQELVMRLRQIRGDKTMVHWIRQLTPEDLASFTRGLRALRAVIAREAEQTERAKQSK